MSRKNHQISDYSLKSIVQSYKIKMHPHQMSQEVSVFKFPHWSLQPKDVDDIIIFHHWDGRAGWTEGVLGLTIWIWLWTKGKASNKEKKKKKALTQPEIIFSFPF